MVQLLSYLSLSLCLSIKLVSCTPVVGGTNVSITHVPYMALLSNCGASIIGPRHVLTAAHCFWNSYFTNIVQTGSAHQRNGVQHFWSQLKLHPDYNPQTQEYDFAVITLQEPLKFDSRTRPVQIDDQKMEIPDGAMMQVSGWGNQEEGNFDTDELLKTAFLPKYNREKCNKDLKIAAPNKNYPIRNVTKAMFCAGWPKGGPDSCVGDSGGPLVYKNVQVGVISWGYGCGNKNTPGVYARVAMAADWIKGVMNEK